LASFDRFYWKADISVENNGRTWGLLGFPEPGKERTTSVVGLIRAIKITLFENPSNTLILGTIQR
jgi:hypothetical protein